MESSTAALEAACDECRWEDAWRLFAGTPRDSLSIDDLDRFATAAHLTGRQDGLSLWSDAFTRCIDERSFHRAAHFGAQLARACAFTGDLPRCRGWIERTARLLDEAAIDCVEQGYLEWGLGMFRVFEAGDMAGALPHFERARKIATRFLDRDLATVGAIAAGRMMIYLGDVGEGLGLLDAAVISIEAGELSPIATGDSYCTVIDACAELSDVVRCRSWTASMREWCDTQQGLVLFRGHCFVHAADVLVELGRWHEGVVEARNACDRLAGTVPMMLGAAACLEGDLLRLLGDEPGAEDAYVRANEFGHDPQPGLALLRLGQGNPGDAFTMLGRALVHAAGPARGRVLGPYVEVALVAGDVDAARSATDELRALAAEVSSAMLGAEAARASGAVHLATDAPEEALRDLRRAFDVFCELGAVHEAARTRLLIADACAALGDQSTATMEADAARRAIDGFRAKPDDDEAVVPLPDGLTGRELEVLRLLAGGSTNRAIGESLFISEKTVASHVSHIFTKLGVSTRAAATAYAYDNKLV